MYGVSEYLFYFEGSSMNSILAVIGILRDHHPHGYISHRVLVCHIHCSQQRNDCLPFFNSATVLVIE